MPTQKYAAARLESSVASLVARVARASPSASSASIESARKRSSASAFPHQIRADAASVGPTGSRGHDSVRRVK